MSRRDNHQSAATAASHPDCRAARFQIVALQAAVAAELLTDLGWRQAVDGAVRSYPVGSDDVRRHFGRVVELAAQGVSQALGRKSLLPEVALVDGLVREYEQRQKLREIKRKAKKAPSAAPTPRQGKQKTARTSAKPEPAATGAIPPGAALPELPIALPAPSAQAPIDAITDLLTSIPAETPPDRAKVGVKAPSESPLVTVEIAPADAIKMGEFKFQVSRYQPHNWWVRAGGEKLDQLRAAARERSVTLLKGGG